MAAIFKREFKSYFTGIIGWLFIAATLAFYFLYFYAYNMLQGSPYLASAIDSVTFIFLVSVPILTMRVLAEEKRAKTDQLLLTSPVSAGKMVMAKFMAMGAVYSIAIAVICLTPLFLNLFGEVPMAESYDSILGIWLYGLTCIAIGTFVSSITESQVIAAILSFLALFLGYMMTGIIEMLPGQSSAATAVISKILSVYDLTTPLNLFLNGRFDFSGIVYYVSIIGLFLFLTVMVIQKRRYSFNKNNLKTILSSGIFTIVVIAVVVGANIGVKQIPTRYTSIDLTEEKIYTLTDTTKDFLKTVDQDINVYVLADEASANPVIAETLYNYADANKHIKLSFVDMITNPTFHEKYVDEMPSQGSIIVESGDKFRLIKYSELFTYEYDYQTVQMNPDGFDTEGQVTSAIAYVTMEEYPIIYQLIGHDETTLSGNFETAIQKINYNLAKLTLLLEDEVPRDCELLIINSPQSDFSEDDTTKIADYLDRGGKALIVASYTDKEMPNLKKILNKAGLYFINGLIVEGDANAYYYQPMYLIPMMQLEDITEDLLYKYVLSPYSAGLMHPGEQPGYKYSDLLYTTASSYIKTNISEDMTLEKVEGDIDGPFIIGTKVENENNNSEVVVYTSVNLFTDNADEMVAGHNSTLFKSTLSDLLSDSEGAKHIAVDAKKVNMGNIIVPMAFAVLVMVVFVWIIPIVLVIIGVIIWMIRRKK